MSVLLRYRWWLLAVIVYGSLASVLLRGGFGAGPSALPQGTNALDYILIFNFWKHYPLSAWLFPYTDWGQPVSGYTGPTPVSLGILLLTPTVLVRAMEFVAIFSAGMCVFGIVVDLGGTGSAALASGFYYAILGETTQFFEGHLPAMVSVALGPLLLYLTYKFFQKPLARIGIPLAVTLYVMSAVGDLALLYSYLFFGVFVAGYSIWTRSRAERYRAHEFRRVGLTIALFVVLMLPWVIPFVEGVRPQYTVLITTTITAFSQTAGQPLGYSLAGFVADNSFITFVDHATIPSANLPFLWPLYYVIPVGGFAFAIVQRRTGPRLLALSAVVAMVFASADLYPYLSSVNAFAYRYLPFFDYQSSLFRWAIYLSLPFAILLGLLLTDLERSGLRTWRSFLHRWEYRLGAIFAARRARIRSPTDRTPSDSSVPHAVRRGPFAERRAYTAVGVAVAVAACSIVVAQNWLVVADPPTIFEFPPGYVGGFQYIGSTPVRGDVLTVPFGSDYEETPWGGVSGSTLLISPYFTGADAATFQAGTPYSLLIDTFIGNGLTFAYSNNVSKFLESANVQYVTATDYPDWSYPTSPVYLPQSSYTSLANQTGLGPPVYQQGYQTVYSLPQYAGNVSWHSQYFVYFGSDALLYSILDQSWYNGSEPLVDGSQLALPDDQAILDHATAIVSDPDTISNLTTAQTTAIEASKTPLVVLVNSLNAPVIGGVQERVPWNSSNAESLVAQSPVQPFQISLGSSTASLLRSSAFELSTRAECAPGTAVQLTLDGNAVGSFIPSPIESRQSLPYNNSSLVSVGDNGTGKYDGTISSYQAKGVSYLEWLLSPGDPHFQFVRFDFPDLGDHNGILADVASGTPNVVPLELQVSYPNGTLTVPSYLVRSSAGGGSMEYGFTLPSGTWVGKGPAPVTFGGDTDLTMGLLDQNSLLRNLTISNVSEFVGYPPHFTTEYAGPTGLTGAGTLAVAATTACRFDTFGLIPWTSGALPPSTAPVRYLDSQSNPTDLTVGPVPSGWGLVELAQTYSTFWNLSLPSGTGIHVPGDLGLNVWLIDAGTAATVRIQYTGQSLQQDGVIGEAIGLPALLLCWFWMDRLRRVKERRVEPPRRASGTSPPRSEKRDCADHPTANGGLHD